MSENKKKKKKEKKKEKVRYVDDGRTIADMSAFGAPKKQEELNVPPERAGKPRWRLILSDYMDAVKMMLLPMLAFIGLLAVAFLIVWIVLTLL